MSHIFGPNIVTNGLVLYLDAGNTKSYSGSGTTWTDLSGNGNNGTLTNGPAYDSANLGGILFDGNNDYITVPDNSSLTSFTNMTLEILVKYNVNNKNQVFVQKWNYGSGNGYGLEIYNGNILAYCMNPYGVYPTVNVNSYSAGVVHHFAVSLNGSTQSFYGNGALINNTSGGNVPSTTGYDFRIGYRSSGGGNDAALNGNVYCVRFYNRALSSAEITQNYNALKSRYGL